jgi:hypothetical protein
VRRLPPLFFFSFAFLSYCLRTKRRNKEMKKELKKKESGGNRRTPKAMAARGLLQMAGYNGW